ncbi:hypothetical protein [Methylobacterium brachiatum]|jgi:hypothetical protein|uniref:hypothetical protein n=1 Tax=Methylobacterium brachiatum TaxID=269660 RepID=UPI002449B93B|nr:hypothetical protein [Methylobacterium brachiatum]MDH2313852.1 hypothetical protein [Methylobacterium brachiatum]
MTTCTLTALYDRYDDAATAVTKLEAAGVPHTDISLVSNTDEDSTHGDGNTAEHAAAGTGAGATLGTVLGGGAGLLAGLGLMAIPGVGPVVAAGWLVATLTGAGIGAAAGGLAGSLAGAGVSDRDARAYSEGVRRGGSLLTVKADEAHFATAARILEEHGAVDLDERAQGWETEGWARAGEARTDASPLTGPDAAAGSEVRGNHAVEAHLAGTDTRMSGARRVRVYDHPL